MNLYYIFREKPNGIKRFVIGSAGRTETEALKNAGIRRSPNIIVRLVKARVMVNA